MKTAADVMDTAFVKVSPQSTVAEIGQALLQSRADGALVMDGDALLGVVTEMDLVFRQKQVHLPTVLYVLDAVISLDPGHRSAKELEKVAGRTAEELMTKKVVSVGPDAPVSKVATLMVEKHLSIVPVVRDGLVLGVVTRRSMLKATLPAED